MESDRRAFFGRALGRVARELAVRTERRFAPRRLLRPPGAISEIAFLTACTRCGECIPVCPVRAITTAPPDAGLAAGTPMIDVHVQACAVCDDMPCARACPTGALVVPRDGWRGVRMAELRLDTDRCIAFQGVACGVCARVCPIGERALAMDAGGRPVIRWEGCVGCGMCVGACVTKPSALELEIA